MAATVQALFWVALAPSMCGACCCACCMLTMMVGCFCHCMSRMCGGGRDKKECDEKWKKNAEEWKAKYASMTEEEKKEMKEEMMEKMGPMKKMMMFGMKMKKMHVDGGPVCSICLNNLAPKCGDSVCQV